MRAWWPGRTAVPIAQVQFVVVMNSRRDTGCWNTFLERRGGIGDGRSFINSHKCTQHCHDEALVTYIDAGMPKMKAVKERGTRERKE